MNLTTALYLTNLISNLGFITAALLLAGGGTLLIAFIGHIFCLDEYNDRNGHGAKFWSAILKKWWIVALTAVVAVSLPSKSTMYMMLGTSYLQESNLPAKVAQALEMKLDDYLKELKK